MDTERLNDAEPVEGEVIDPPTEITIVPQAGPFSPEERAQVVEWIKAGVSRNEIKRRTGRGGATITRIAQDNGLTFSPAEMMRPALEAQALDKKAKRIKLAELLLDDAFKLREQLFKPTTIYFFDYKSGKVYKQKIKEPQPKDKRDLATSIGILVDKVAGLEALDRPQEGRQAIVTLVDNLRLQVAKEIHNDSQGDES